MAVIPLGHASLRGSSDLPGTSTPKGALAGLRAEPARAGIAPGLVPYLVLLRVGFTLPRNIAARAVRSYRTFSPLLRRRRRGGVFSVALSVGRALSAVSRTLSGTLLCGVRTFLPRIRSARETRR